MNNQFQESQNRTLASKFVNNVFLDFLLSRQAMMCTDETIKYYEYNLGRILDWMQEHGVEKPEEINSRHVRTLLSDMANRGCSDAYMNLYARVIKTFTRFMHEEGFI